MELEELVRQRITANAKDGVRHVTPEFEERFPDFSLITLDALQLWWQEVKQECQEAESFSVRHLYLWSLESHLTSIITAAKLL